MKIKQVILAALLVAFAGNIPIAQAQPRPPYPIDRNQNSQIRKEFEDLLDRIADKADRFRKSFDRARQEPLPTSLREGLERNNFQG